jgi:predicted membrane protein
METIGKHLIHALLMVLTIVIAGFLVFLEEFSRYADDISPYE